MQVSSSLSARRTGRTVLPSLTLAVLLTATSPGLSRGEDRGELRDLVREFNSICVELQAARVDLERRVTDETGFGDRVLDLFVRADSITQLLAERFPDGSRSEPAFALGWALRHLRESLRENFEGIVEGNGYRFVNADLALRAAEAWRGNIGQTDLSTP